MITAAPTGGDPEPLDEQAYIRLLFIMEVTNPNFPDAQNWNRVIAGARQLLAEVIRLRNQAREAQQRVTLLPPGQQILPLVALPLPAPAKPISIEPESNP